MDEQRNQEQEIVEAAEPEQPYEPRPAWQVWAARIGLVVFVALILMYYVNIARGGR